MPLFDVEYLGNDIR